MNFPSTSRLPRKSLLRGLAVVALLASVAFAFVFTYSAKGNTPVIPPLPSKPLHDTKAAKDAEATKIAIDAADEQRMKDARAGKLGKLEPKDGTGDLHLPAPGPIPSAQPTAPDTGISNELSPPSGWGARYRITNYWYGNVGKKRVSVYAGSVVDDYAKGTWNDPEQGVVILYGKDAKDVAKSKDKNEYLTPTRTGRLSVKSYNGTCLRLVSTNSTAYTFDVATQSWSCSTETP